MELTNRRSNYLFKEMKITENFLDENQYYKVSTDKNQIVLHHTAGGGNAINTIHGWNFNPERVGTAFVIDEYGAIFKAFDPEYWAHHIGLKMAGNLELNKHSIGIEVCNWGQLIFKDGKYYNYLNREIKASEVVKIPKFRGFEYYHKYNDAQLISLKWLVSELCKDYKIPTKFDYSIFDINENALLGKAGIYTHVSYRKDKNDMSPQPNLLKTLLEL